MSETEFSPSVYAATKPTIVCRTKRLPYISTALAHSIVVVRGKCEPQPFAVHILVIRLTAGLSIYQGVSLEVVAALILFYFQIVLIFLFHKNLFEIPFLFSFFKFASK